MPEKTKTYKGVIFSPEVLRAAIQALIATLSPDKRKMTGEGLYITLSSGERWSNYSEDEFFSDYRKGFEYAHFYKTYGYESSLKVFAYSHASEVSVQMPDRGEVERVFEIFESSVERCRIPEPPPKKRQRPIVKIFIGHGHDRQWRDMKDHLHEKHGLHVEAYEIGARAGLTIKEVLDTMLTGSSVALLVLTGEDLDATGKPHARENVVHELGLFQGRLGWRKAIALLEEGTVEFSNIQGLNQIRFSKGNIQETFGEVLATIKREFPEED